MIPAHSVIDAPPGGAGKKDRVMRTAEPASNAGSVPKKQANGYGTVANPMFDGPLETPAAFIAVT